MTQNEEVVECCMVPEYNILDDFENDKVVECSRTPIPRESLQQSTTVAQLRKQSNINYGSLPMNSLLIAHCAIYANVKN